MDETNRRRLKQIEYNTAHHITPRQIQKSTGDILGQTAVADSKRKVPSAYVEKENYEIAADPVVPYMTKEKIQKLITKTRKAMEEAVRELDFLEAARYRDELLQLHQYLEAK